MQILWPFGHGTLLCQESCEINMLRNHMKNITTAYNCNLLVLYNCNFSTKINHFFGYSRRKAAFCLSVVYTLVVN